MPSYICLIHLLSSPVPLKSCTTPEFQAKKKKKPQNPAHKMTLLAYSWGLSCFPEHLLIWHQHNTRGSRGWGLWTDWKMQITEKQALSVFIALLCWKGSKWWSLKLWWRMRCFEWAPLLKMCLVSALLGLQKLKEKPWECHTTHTKRNVKQKTLQLAQLLLQ